MRDTGAERRPFFLIGLGAELDEESSLLYGRTGCNAHTCDSTRRRRSQFVFHLHRFHNDESLARVNSVALAHKDPHDESRHGRNERLRTNVLILCELKVADSPYALVERLNFMTVPADP